ncbi:SpoIIE family protein phosphatase [Pseudonocardia oroxyli]|uniref:STAS domain-containing protein n=1 Tax=Pseudonocardia oroxyli TaxID=366584 RepID=A0A1G7XQ21_PSEOR|nr:SpoIIE family protein phosphatase [Pseudonocardia oroxyli]SDG86292.1 STAS domain-containing protein [Pseudonocardia oroxyli]
MSADLQRAVLPTDIPLLPGVRVAACALLAETDADARGDWFDVVPTPAGQVGLVVGDVGGRGVAATVLTARLRTLVGERLAAGASIGETCAAAEALARRAPEVRGATMCLLVLDPDSGELRYCTAGHPPPLVLPAGGEPRYLPPSGSGPVGMGSACAVAAARLEPDDLVLLCTDGVLDRPGRDATAGTVELAQVAADAVGEHGDHRVPGAAAERACVDVMDALLRRTGHSDDLTLLSAQRLRRPDALGMSWSAEASAVRASRVVLAEWLRGLGLDEADLVSVQHAVGELMTNAVEHAYVGAGSETVRLEGALTDDGELRLRVSDHGIWRCTERDPPGGLGRGLAMTRHLCGELFLDRRVDGTSATVCFRPAHPARLLSAGPAPVPPGDGARDRLAIRDRSTASTASGARIRLDGAVDEATAVRLQAELRHRTQAGTRPLTVDLTGVTRLTAGGVAVLHGAMRDALPGAPLRLCAPPDSVAGYVLDLVALPYADDAARVP